MIIACIVSLSLIQILPTLSQIQLTSMAISNLYTLKHLVSKSLLSGEPQVSVTFMNDNNSRLLCVQSSYQRYIHANMCS